MFMATAGFEALSGCECGCGVSCNRAVGYDHARWVCPTSIGYACSSELGATLFYQPEPDMAPCAEQNTSVRWVTAFFMFGLPGICGILAVVPARQSVIPRDVHQKIIAGIEALNADPNAVVEDPLIGGQVVRPANTAESMYHEQFSLYERTLAQRGKLVAYLGGRLGLYASVIIVLISVNAVFFSHPLIQVSCWGFALFIVLVPLDSVRIFAASRGPPAGDGVSLSTISGSATTSSA